MLSVGQMVECSFKNYVVLGLSPVAVTSPSDFVPASSKEFLDIQATIECGFTLKRIHDMTRTYSQLFWGCLMNSIKSNTINLKNIFMLSSMQNINFISQLLLETMERHNILAILSFLGMSGHIHKKL